jgi:ABC-type methionine transport system ATPase subunit
LFEELNKLGTTVVIATHNESIVNDYGRPVLRIDAGRLKIIPQTDVHNRKNEPKLNIQSNLVDQKEVS